MSEDYIAQGVELKLIQTKKQKIRFAGEKTWRALESPQDVLLATMYVRLIVEYGYDKSQIHIEETENSGIPVLVVERTVRDYLYVYILSEEMSSSEYQEYCRRTNQILLSTQTAKIYVMYVTPIKSESFHLHTSDNIIKSIVDIPASRSQKSPTYKYIYQAEEFKKSHPNTHFKSLTPVNYETLNRCFKSAHNALWAGGQLNPSEAFDELDKLIFCKIWDERNNKVIGAPYAFQIIAIDESDNYGPAIVRQKENENLYNRILALYEKGREQDSEVFRENIRLSPEKIRTVVSYLEGFDLSNSDLDSKGRAFETFMDSFFRGSFGQYFTPRPIVEFIIDVLPITNTTRILDTSCGSGGFLLYSLDKVRKVASSKTDLLKMQQYAIWHEFASQNLYGIEINEQISRAAKMNMIIHDDGHTNVITLDGLLPDEKIRRYSGNDEFNYNSFDMVITNPPFGSMVRRKEKEYFENYKLSQHEQGLFDVNSSIIGYRESQSSEVLFIEQAYNFLKEGGWLAIVLPDSVLTNSTTQYVRNRLEEWFRIVSIVSLPQSTFVPNGAMVKTSVLFARKYTKSETERIVMLKKQLQIDALSSVNYFNEIFKFEKSKKALKKAIVEQIAREKGLTLSNAQKTQEYKKSTSDQVEAINNNVALLKSKAESKYQELLTERMPDYPIFMAIADNVGYDTSGKEIAQNDLHEIAEELKAFITQNQLQ